MTHRMSTTTCRDEFVLRCTCTPDGTLFIGTKEACARNKVQHERLAAAEREHEIAMQFSPEHAQYCAGPHGHVVGAEVQPEGNQVSYTPRQMENEWLYGDSPAGLRRRAAEDLAAEFGTDVSEWEV